MATVHKIDISSGTIFRILIAITVVWFLFLVRDVLVMLVASFVIASAIEPVARVLRPYHIPRALSAVIVYIFAFALIGLSVSLVIPAFVDQIGPLTQSIPQIVTELGAKFGITSVPAVNDVVPQLQQNASQIGQGIGNVSSNIFAGTRTVFSSIFSLLFVFIIAFYLVIEEDALKKLFRFIIPKEHVKYADKVIDRIQQRLGRWVIAQLTLGIIIGFVVGIGLWLMGVPYALSLGLLAGVLEIIPVIGPIIAGTIGVIIALSQSLFLGLGVLVFYVVVQQVENHALIPSLMRKATGLNPLVTIIAVLLGARLLGLVGVILSIPVATIISILAADLFSTSSTDDELAG